MKKILFGMALAIAAAAPAFAAWPNDKPVTLVVPFPPGGSTDNIARVIAQKLPEKLGGTWIVDNKPGATGTIGAAFVKRAPADGYTLFVSSLGPFVIAPHLIKGVQYDALKDLDPITVAVQAPNVLVVPVNSPDKTVAELLAHLKKTPGKVSFARVVNIGAIVFDLARLRMQQAREHLDQSRLPCSIRTDDQMQLTRRE